MLKTRQPIWHSACTNVESLAMSVFHIPSDTNPTVKCSKSDILEPENLCLFGASRKASELKNPGYISKSKLQPNSIWLNHSSRVSNIESDNSQNVGLEDYNNISDGIFPHFTTPSIKITLG